MKTNNLKYALLSGLISTFLAPGAITVNATLPGLVPLPKDVIAREGFFTLTSKTVIVAEGDAQTEAETLAETLRTATKLPLKVVKHNSTDGAVIEMQIMPASAVARLGEEGYMLNVSPNGVKIIAAGTAGLFYGGQTLLQLLPPAIYSDIAENTEWKAHCAIIRDQPRFKWRGMMLDVSRHFLDAEFVKRYIDLLAMHKINIFHWHLTDDDGWRIEIKAYPKLTEVGAWRGDNEALPPSRGSGPTRYGGFYTQEQIRDIVAYAAKRHINILPEIDVPGHTRAITAAYPETLPAKFSGGKQNVPANAISPASETNYTMMTAIFKEIAELFPFEYIHIGGDEVNYKLWENDPEIKSLMKREGLSDLKQVQNYFTRQLDGILAKHDRKLIGWNEILNGGSLRNETGIMAWIGTAPGIAAARKGHPVVMAPGPYNYFDMKYPGPGERGHTWAGIVSTEKTYSFDPLGFKELNAEERKLIMGTQACLWTEYVEDGKRAEYMTFPRLCALAEVAWTPREKQSWSKFQNRLGDMLARLEVRQVNFHIPMPSAQANNGTVSIMLPFRGAQVRYTIDGTDPGPTSTLYSKPFFAPDPGKVFMRTFIGDRRSNVQHGAEKKPFAKWSPENTKETFQNLSFDVSHIIDRPGDWKLELIHTDGRGKLTIRSATLLENGREVSIDKCPGKVNRKRPCNIHTLKLPEYDKRATYTVTIDVKTGGGSASFGNLVLEHSNLSTPDTTNDAE